MAAPPPAAGTTYTYDASSKNFTFKNTSASDAGAITTLANGLRPATGTSAGVYVHNNGTASTSFEVDATGVVTIGGATAFLDADGNLSTNNAGTGAAAATLATVMTAAAQNTAANNSSVTISGKTYSSVGTANQLSFTDTITSDALLAKVNANATANDIVMKIGSGITTATLTFTDGTSTNTFIDDKDRLTTTQTYTTTYTVDPNNGLVHVKSGTGTGDYAAKVGELARITSGGKLTTDETSQGTQTTDPLKTLDAAFSVLNKLTGEMGAVQNRLESTINNLDNVVNNLSNARSRIQDADYATEVSNMSRAQILQQAGTSVLAQANQVPQTVLSLLR